MKADSINNLDSQKIELEQKKEELNNQTRKNLKLFIIVSVFSPALILPFIMYGIAQDKKINPKAYIPSFIAFLSMFFLLRCILSFYLSHHEKQINEIEQKIKSLSKQLQTQKNPGNPDGVFNTVLTNEKHPLLTAAENNIA